MSRKPSRKERVGKSMRERKIKRKSDRLKDRVRKRDRETERQIVICTFHTQTLFMEMLT